MPAAGTAVGHGGAVLAAGRFGYLDRILAGALSSDTHRLLPLSRYRDFQGKVFFPLRDDERAEVIFLTSSDSGAVTSNSASPSLFAPTELDSLAGLRCARRAHGKALSLPLGGRRSLLGSP